MSIIQGTGRGGARGFYDFPIEQSLRFDGTSSYLSRTPTATGNQKVWTFSVWVKRSIISTSDIGSLLSSTTHGGYYDGITQLGFSTSDTIFVYYDADTGDSSGNPNNSVFRDTSSFYHLVWSVDAGNTSNSIYVNGLPLTLSLSPINYSYAMNEVNQLVAIGRAGWTSARFFEGYLANIQFIDGQALDPYFFGEFKDNIWVPYNAFSTAGSGTATASDGDTATDSYGTNGFHLTFEDGIESLPVGGYTGNQNAFRDKSHNTNHWKIN